jgi:nickel-dependent lactate racemase
VLVEIWLPYGRTEIPARIPEERLIEILRPAKTDHPLDANSEMKRLAQSSGLIDRARRAGRICVALGHCSNPQVLQATTGALVQEILAAQTSSDSITILSVPGSPGFSSDAILQSRIIQHDPISSQTRSVEGFRSDFELSLNSVFLEADLKILVGELKPHPFLGYCGVYDIPFPGLASSSSALSQLIDRKQIEVSDLFEERMKVTRSIPNLFSLGIVLDSERTPAKFGLSENTTCFNELKAASQHFTSKEIERLADIVIISAGGSPWDDSLANAVEAIPAGLVAAKRDGSIIFAAECGKGHGGGAFYAWCAEKKEPRHLEARLRHNFNYDGYKAAFLLRALEAHRVYLVSTIADHYVESVFRMKAARTINSALQTAQRTLGSDSTITVIPEANAVALKQVKKAPDQNPR